MKNNKTKVASLIRHEIPNGVAEVDELRRRWWIWIVYALLFGTSVPWYLPKGRTPEIWFGLPSWVIISLLASIGIAVFTAFVVHRYWSETEPWTNEMKSGGEQP